MRSFQVRTPWSTARTAPPSSVPDNNVVVETNVAPAQLGSEGGSPTGIAVDRATFADVVALTVSAVLGAALTLAPLTYLMLPGVDLPEPFADQHQTAETASFLLTFGVVLPLAVYWAPRVADRIAAVSAVAVAGAAAFSCVTLIAGLLFIRVSRTLPWGGGIPALMAVMALWWSVVAVVIGRALTRVGGIGLLEWLGTQASYIWTAVGMMLLGVVAGFAIWSSVSPLVLAVASMSAVLGLVAISRFEPRGPLRPGWAVDLAVVWLLLLAVPNLVILRPEVNAESFLTLTIDMHQNFFVAPASDLLAGG
ncbi:MAG: hypothetical protein KDB46_11565, partial [Solirubrobacterales bacterium]|nr:hypothetical protein [Solirubrobacterales bacterium]